MGDSLKFSYSVQTGYYRLGARYDPGFKMKWTPWQYAGAPKGAIKTFGGNWGYKYLYAVVEGTSPTIQWAKCVAPVTNT
jgi:hypothetical protein